MQFIALSSIKTATFALFRRQCCGRGDLNCDVSFHVQTNVLHVIFDTICGVPCSYEHCKTFVWMYNIMYRKWNINICVIIVNVCRHSGFLFVNSWGINIFFYNLFHPNLQKRLAPEAYWSDFEKFSGKNMPFKNLDNRGDLLPVIRGMSQICRLSFGIQSLDWCIPIPKSRD